MTNISPQYPIIPAKEKIVVPGLETSMGERLGGVRLGSDAMTWGDGETLGTIDVNGIYLGSSDYTTAPFYVSMAGAVVASSLTVSGGTITGATIQTSATGKRIVITGTNNSLTAYDASDIIKAQIQGALATSIFGRTIGSDFAAWFVKDDGANGDVSDTSDVIQIDNQGRGKGLQISNINATVTSTNLDVSTNAQDQPRIAMGSSTELPTSGTHAVGDRIVIRGIDFICTGAGTPGTFESVSGNYYYGIAGESISADEWVGLGHNTTTEVTTVDKDSYVDEDNPDTNYGTNNFLKLQTLDAGAGEKSDILIRFDLSSVPDADDGIYEVELWLKVLTNNLPNGYYDVSIRRATQTWTEDGVTWNNKPGTDSVIHATSRIVSGFTGWVAFNITNLYLDWVNGILDNDYGIYVYIYGSGVTGFVDSSMLFGSNDGGDTNRPKIVVDHQGDRDKLYETDTTTGNNTYKVKGVAVHSAAADGDPIIIQTAGHYKGWATSTLVANQKYYLSTTGTMSTTPATYVKPVAVGIDADEMIIDIQPGFHTQFIELDGGLTTPDFQTGDLYTYTGFKPSRVEILCSMGFSSDLAWSHGLQIGDSSSCQYLKATGVSSLSGHSTTLSYYADLGTTEITGDLTLSSSGYRLTLASLNTTSANAFLQLKAHE